MNPLAKYLITIGIFAAYTFGVYEFGVSNKGTSDKLATTESTLTQTQGARSTEHALNDTAWNVDAAYQKGLLEGRQHAQTLTDSLLSGSVGMYVPTPAAPAVSGTAPTVSVPAPATQCRLPGKTAADLTNLARDANERTEQANALIDYYEGTLSKLGHPELIAK